MTNIFISYRRGDSIATAGRIRDRLVQEFGRNRVFVDVDDIPHGRDFVEVLEGKVAECGVLLAIIGPHWLDARDDRGNSRLDDVKAFVAKRDVPVDFLFWGILALGARADCKGVRAGQ